MSDLYESLDWYELAKMAINWNSERLPDNTIDMQYIKVAEEIDEYKNAKTRKEKKKEASDVFISAIGLLRFCLEDLDKEFVAEKLDKLKKRKWSIVNGTYHH